MLLLLMLLLLWPLAQSAQSKRRHVDVDTAVLRA